MEDSPIKSRLLEFIKFKGINQSAFNKECGLSGSFVQNIRKSIDVGTFEEKISPKFPELNKCWLYFGDGDMIVTNKEKIPILADINQLETQLSGVMDKDDIIKELLSSLRDQIKMKDEKIKRLEEELDKSKKTNQNFIND